MASQTEESSTLLEQSKESPVKKGKAMFMRGPQKPQDSLVVQETEQSPGLRFKKDKHARARSDVADPQKGRSTALAASRNQRANQRSTLCNRVRLGSSPSSGEEPYVEKISFIGSKLPDSHYSKLRTGVMSP